MSPLCAATCLRRRGLCTCGYTGLRCTHAAVADQLRALLQVRRVEQSRNVDFDEVTVGHIQAAVSECEPTGFGEKMHRVGLQFEFAAGTHDTRGRKGRNIAHSEDPEHLRYRNTARRRRWEAADAPLLVVGANGLTLLDLIGGEVRDREPARVRVRTHRLDDIGRNVARVKGVRIRRN